jgi:2-oxoglutarate dehydrogenase complex dehydrogenase (E1) component-like enzyme
MSNETFDVNGEEVPPNWRIVNCTTPAQYFHVLRRQVRKRDFVKGGCQLNVLCRCTFLIENHLLS